MKGIICYYSGSGNTELACRYIAGNLKSIEFDFLNIITDGNPALEKYDIVGFATFTNFLNVPPIIRSFIENLPGQNKPAFVFNTYGFISGRTLGILEKLVKDKGFKIIAGHSLHTPESYPPMIIRGRGNEQAPNEKEMKDFNKFITVLDRLFNELNRDNEIGRAKIKIGLLNSLMPAFSLTKARDDMGEKYVDEALCNECGLCEKLCPYIAIKCSPKPVFEMNKCYGCWTCYNHCPVRAIYTAKYRGAGHYPQPIKQLKKKLNI